MATLTLFIKGGRSNPKTNSKDESLLYWKYVHQEKSILISTTYKVYPTQLNWMEKGNKFSIDRYEPILKSCHAYSVKNKNIKTKGELLETIIENLKTEGQEPTIELVRLKIESLKKPKNTRDLFIYMEQIAGQMYANGQIRRAEKYRTIIKKAQKILKTEKILLSNVDRGVLEKYQKAARENENNKLTTVDADLKVIRATLNKALEEGLIKSRPTFKGLVRDRKTLGKTGLTIEQLIKLINYSAPETSIEFHARNLWLFSFYNAGIRIGDLLQLTWRNINGSTLEYIMSKIAKTERAKVTLDLQEPASSILKHYSKNKQETSVIFPLLSQQVQHLIVKYPIEERENINPEIVRTILNEISAKTTIVNKALKSIAKNLGFKTKLSNHIARHTYAQLARAHGANLADLRNILNHSNEKITEVYSASSSSSTANQTHKKVLEQINESIIKSTELENSQL